MVTVTRLQCNLINEIGKGKNMKLVKKDVPFEAYDVLDCQGAECGLITNFEGEGYVASVRDPEDHDKRHIVEVAGLSIGTEEAHYIDGDIYHAVADVLVALEIALFPEDDGDEAWPYDDPKYMEQQRQDAYWRAYDEQLEFEARYGV